MAINHLTTSIAGILRNCKTDKKMEKTKKQWIKLKLIALLTFLFWIIETIIFQIKYGWHWNTTQTDELVCDFVVKIGSLIITIMFLNVIIKIADNIL